MESHLALVQHTVQFQMQMGEHLKAIARGIAVLNASLPAAERQAKFEAVASELERTAVVLCNGCGSLVEEMIKVTKETERLLSHQHEKEQTDDIS